MRKVHRTLILAAALFTLGSGITLNSLQAKQATPAAAGTVSGMTEPSARRKLNFPLPGPVKEVLIKEGDTVKVGDVLIQQEDTADMLELKRLEREATSTYRIEANKADLGVKQKTLERMKNAGPNAFQGAEMEAAELEVIVRQKQIGLAEDEQAQAMIKRDQQQDKVEKMKVRSPVEGIVEKLNVGAGELGDPNRLQDGAIVVVQNNPLDVVVRDLTTEQVKILKSGQTMKVRYNDSDTWEEASISYIAPVADMAVGTQMIKLKLPNPSGRVAGLPVTVQMPATTVSASATK